MAQFHFVEDYERYVRLLMRRYPIDEAMSIAVGGDYEKIGGIESEILLQAGLRAGQSMVDFGCGSGRLAVALSKEIEIDYLGLDVVQPLLDYAARRSPRHYRYKLNRALSLPAETQTADLICAFSVFTHLLLTETFIDLEDTLRCLKPGGRLVISFLELAQSGAWKVFTDTVEQQRAQFVPTLNAFLERGQVETLVRHLRHGTACFEGLTFFDPDAAPWPSGRPLGQTVAFLTKSS